MRATDLLARTFWDDPVVEHLLPHEPTRYRRLRHLYAFVLADGRRRGLVHTTPELESIAVWQAPGRRSTGPGDVVRALPMGLRAFGPTRIPKALATLDAIERRHPREPHWYLELLGTDPLRKGRGAAGGLLGPVLDNADRDGLPAYLESSKAANVGFYERWGFEVTDELTLPNGGPPMWLMWRTPRTT